MKNLPNTFEWVLPGTTARIQKRKTRRNKKNTISDTFNTKKQNGTKAGLATDNNCSGIDSEDILLSCGIDLNSLCFIESPINLSEENVIEENIAPSIYQQALEILQANDNFQSEAERMLKERTRFYVIPEGGEKARNIIHHIKDNNFIAQRVEEAETSTERRILLRMNPNAARNVTWRQDLTIDLPRGEVAELFIKKRLESSAPISDDTTKKKMNVEGGWTEPQEVQIRTICWQSTATTTLPTLLTPHWYLKKWESKEGFILRAQCTELIFVWKEELDEMRMEFTYYTEFFNEETQSWQQC